MISSSSSATSSVSATDNTGASQYDTLASFNQVDGSAQSNYGKSTPDPAASHYGSALKANKDANGYLIPTYASGVATIDAGLPNLQLDLLPPLSSGNFNYPGLNQNTGYSTSFNGQSSVAADASLSFSSATKHEQLQPQNGVAFLPADVSLLNRPGDGPITFGSSPHSRPTGLEKGSSGSYSGNKYGSGSYGGAPSGTNTLNAPVSGSPGSYHNPGAPNHSSATPTSGEKYTGGFGGPTGVLGEQKVPGYAVNGGTTAHQQTVAAIVPTSNTNTQFIAVPVVLDNQRPTTTAGSSYGGVRPTGQNSGSYAPQGGSGVSSVAPSAQPAYPSVGQQTQPTSSGSYGGNKPSTGSYGSSQPSNVGTDNNKYTGGFGGAPGVLGNQAVPGFATNQGSTAPTAHPTYPSVTTAAVQQTQPTSSGSYGGSKPSNVGTDNNKYNGGFGGAPGVLGNQAVPGFATNQGSGAPLAQSSYPSVVQPTQPAVSGSYGGNKPSTGSYGGSGPGFTTNQATTAVVQQTQPTYGGNKPTTGSYGGSKPTTSSAGADNKYTGGFGGAPGVLGEQVIPGFATNQGSVAPTETTAFNQQGQQGFGVGHHTDVNQGPHSNKPSVALLPPSTAHQNTGSTTSYDDKIVFLNEPSYDFGAAKPIYPQSSSSQYPQNLGQYPQGGGGSYGVTKKPTQQTTTGSGQYQNVPSGNAGTGGSYGGQQQQPTTSSGSGSYGGANQNVPLGNAGAGGSYGGQQQKPLTSSGSGSYGGANQNVASGNAGTGGSYGGQQQQPSTSSGSGSYGGANQNVASGNPGTGSSYGGQQQKPSTSSGSGSYGGANQNVPSGGSYGGSVSQQQPSSGSGSYGGANQNAPSSGSYGGQKPQGDKPGKYTGGFGGGPGVLGEQKHPGFAVQPDGTIRDPTIAGATGVAQGVHHQQQTPQNTGTYNSHASTAAVTGSYSGGKHTSGFGGPPGILTPYDNERGTH